MRMLVGPSTQNLATSAPLRDRLGGPACGNIGQVGRPVDRAGSGRSLLASGDGMDAPVGRPLRDRLGGPAAGNVMRKSLPDDYPAPPPPASQDSQS